MVDLGTLEKLLIKNWTEFVNVRELIPYLHNIAFDLLDVQSPLKVTKIVMTRCELTTGLTVWFDFIVCLSQKEVKITSEFFLTNIGLSHIKSIIN